MTVPRWHNRYAATPPSRNGEPWHSMTRDTRTARKEKT